MAVKVTLPDIKQPFTDSGGKLTKAAFDFLRTLWNRTGGNQDAVSELQDEASTADLLIFRNEISRLAKRVKDLEQRLDSAGLI